MGLKHSQQLLIAVIVACLAYIAFWWYQSPHGPGGRYLYGVTQLTWVNSTITGVGNLVVALGRTPSAKHPIGGGKVVDGLGGPRRRGRQAGRFVAGRRRTPSRSSFGGTVTGATVSSTDPGANTMTFGPLTAPAGWPGVAPGATWTAATTLGAKGAPSVSVRIAPAKKG